MENTEMCEHQNSPLFCKKCGREVFDNLMKMKLEQAKEFYRLISEEELDIHSPEFLRQT